MKSAPATCSLFKHKNHYIYIFIHINKILYRQLNMSKIAAKTSHEAKNEIRENRWMGAPPRPAARLQCNFQRRGSMKTMSSSTAARNYRQFRKSMRGYKPGSVQPESCCDHLSGTLIADTPLAIYPRLGLHVEQTCDTLQCRASVESCSEWGLPSHRDHSRCW